MINETKLNTPTYEQEIRRIKCIIEQRTIKINDLCKQVRMLRQSNEDDLKIIEDLENKILFRPTSR